jgi:hypothetical protein
VRKGWQLIVAGAKELAPGIDVILGEDFFHKAGCRIRPGP